MADKNVKKSRFTFSGSEEVIAGVVDEKPVENVELEQKLESFKQVEKRAALVMHNAMTKMQQMIELVSAQTNENSEKIIQSVVLKADEFLSNAKAEAEKCVEAAKEESAKIISDADEKSAEIIKNASSQSEKIISYANDKASQKILDADKTLTDAKAKSDEIISNAESSANEITDNANKLLENTQNECDALVKQANAKSEEIVSNANKDIESQKAELKTAIDNANQKQKEIDVQLFEVNKQRDKIIFDAKKEAEEIIAQSASEAEEKLKTAAKTMHIVQKYKDSVISTIKEQLAVLAVESDDEELKSLDGLSENIKAIENVEMEESPEEIFGEIIDFGEFSGEQFEIDEEIEDFKATVSDDVSFMDTDVNLDENQANKTGFVLNSQTSVDYITDDESITQNPQIAFEIEEDIDKNKISKFIVNLDDDDIGEEN